MKKVKRYEGKASSIPASSGHSDSNSSPDQDSSMFLEPSNVTTIATAAASPKTTTNHPAVDDSRYSLDTSAHLATSGFEDADFDLYNMEIPHEVVPANDIEDMVRIAMHGKVSEKNRLVANLTELAFTYTIENLPSHQSRAPLDQIWYEAGLKFDEVLVTLPTEQVWQDRLFKYFPNHSWPKEFLDYIQDLKEKKPSQTWLNKTPRVMGLEATEQNITYFGNLLRDRYLTVRNFVKWHLSKKWKDPEDLPPGWTLNKLLYAIRKSLWPAECRRRYFETASRKARRQKLPEDEARTLTEAPREVRRWDPNWYPSQWLTFLFLNPGPSKHIDYMFSSSSSVPAAVTGTTAGNFAPSSSSTYPNYAGVADDDDSSDEEVVQKKRKRPATLSAASLRSGHSTAPAAASTPISVASLPLSEEEKKLRDCEVSIRALEKKIAILTRQNRPEEELRVVESELLECLSIQADLYKKFRPNPN